MKQPAIITIAGASGVGKSSLTILLANTLSIRKITSTDDVREVARSFVGREANPALHHSTYEPGMNGHYKQSSEEVQHNHLIHEYETQSGAVLYGLNNVINRAMKENQSLIVEGAHLIPSFFRDTEAYKRHSSHIIQYLVYVERPEVHQRHFHRREQEAPERKISQYFNHFREIRWIHDYLFQDATRLGGVHLVNNSGDMYGPLADILQALREDFSEPPVSSIEETSSKQSEPTNSIATSPGGVSQR